MADHTDFLDLYRKLRLDADCTLAEFKQAYRRHVSQWHPDRRADTRAGALAAARLQRLTVQYSAAMEFHKRHGRLPGAAAAPRRHATNDVNHEVGVVTSPRRADVPQEPVAPSRGVPPVSRILHTRWALVGGGIVIAALAWSMLPTVSTPDVSEWHAGAARAATAPVALRGLLASGMDADEVIAVEGEPTRRAEDHWEYGPSWIRFDGGVVTDWHSSPLRPLHANATAAGAQP